MDEQVAPEDMQDVSDQLAAEGREVLLLASAVPLHGIELGLSPDTYDAKAGVDLC
jgi:hypothetical protein